MAIASALNETLEASRDEIKSRLNGFTKVLEINPDEVHLSNNNLGSGSFAGKRYRYKIPN